VANTGAKARRWPSKELYRGLWLGFHKVGAYAVRRLPTFSKLGGLAMPLCTQVGAMLRDAPPSRNSVLYIHLLALSVNKLHQTHFVVVCLVVKYYSQAILRPLSSCARGQLPPLPPVVTPLQGVPKIFRAPMYMAHCVVNGRLCDSTAFT